MIDYKTLKHSDNGMPTWDGFLGPTLAMASTKKQWKLHDLMNETVKSVSLPKELAEMRYASKWHDPVALNRVNWAISDLKLSGMLHSPKRGQYEITDLGKSILKEYDLNITRELIHSQSAYIEHKERLANNKNNVSDSVSEEETFELTEKQISSWFDKQTSDLAEQLLAKLRSTDPYQFEHMMVTLLNNMGYKGTDGQSLVTQKSNDGGIDGIINQDPLGLQTIYVQVKRYAENNVIGSPEIDSFSGALRRKRADRGVFITTSSFTSGAQQAAKQLNIALVDGEMLTNLMIQYKVGVQIHQVYELYDVDDDFFEE